MGVDAKKVKIVHPNDLGSEGVDDLLVQDLLSKKNGVLFGKGGPCPLIPDGHSRLDGGKGFPRKKGFLFFSSGAEDKPDKLGVRFGLLNHHIPNSAMLLAGRSIYPTVQEFAQKIEILDTQFHRGQSR